MKVKLRSYPAMARTYIRWWHPEYVPSPEQRKWLDILKGVDGMTLEVETKHLFEDQFNTGPIPEVSETGIRVMNNMVEEIIDDVRPFAGKCDYCWKVEQHTPDNRIGKTCEKCKHGTIKRIKIIPHIVR